MHVGSLAQTAHHRPAVYRHRGGRAAPRLCPCIWSMVRRRGLSHDHRL
ncbi:hypothetical protein E2C01_087038 [Portunus trituberculatus]|uniref:Uncharacterized protein n=1 Tax=Portunus trituberculatus TaxID=210409 RepID=A0A5B7J2C8_PORTR|nr:hypothetical protein [Portunus trituberculatus]